MLNDKLTLDYTIQQTQNILSKYGHHFDLDCPYTLKGKENLKYVDDAQVRLIIDSLLSYNSIVEEAPLPDESECEVNTRHLKKFLSHYKLKVSDSFLTSIKDHHIIEVYAKNHQQIYRSVNFFGLSSYGLEALTFVPWDELFHRPESVAHKLFQFANVIMEQNLEVLTPPGTSHTLTELKTENRFRYELERAGCLYDNETSENMGYITLIKVTKAPTLKILH